jgi:UDPglucose--hexose-1-phosphate uridylyltransferase
MLATQGVSHRRLNPLTGEWVLVSPHRNQRPWTGQSERPAAPAALPHDPGCYLCPGNRRANGDRNPDYAHTFVFANDFPALQSGIGHDGIDRGGLIVAKAEPGVCRVICYSPRHDLTMARLAVDDIVEVVAGWRAQYAELGAMADINAVQIFENCGAAMGASNPHPHGQIWSSGDLPNETAKELAAQGGYRAAHGSCLLCDYLRLEAAAGERIVFRNAHFTVLVPFWAIWPFETMVLPHRHVTALDELTGAEERGLAEALSGITIRYDNVFETPFPYSMGLHQRPTDGAPHPEWHFHLHFYPPLLRSATIRKFMVGFELLGSPQRDITAETAAARLRDVSPVHYLAQAGLSGGSPAR